MDDADDSGRKRVVKCALPKVLRGDIRKSFIDVVESRVKIISKQTRQASLALLYHLTSAASRGDEIPDLYNQLDSWWYKWLHLDLSGGGTSPVVPADEMTFIEGTIRDLPKEQNGVVDNILIHAGIAFKTCVTNNAWVPLIPRIVRLVKSTVQKEEAEANDGEVIPKGMTHRIVNLVRRGTTEGSESTGLPEWASSLAAEIRERLKMTDGVYLHDDYGKSSIGFHDLFMFNFWVQQRLTEMGQKRIALSPVMHVKRHCIRIDKKSILEILQKLAPDVQEVKDFRLRQRLIANAKSDEYKNPNKMLISLGSKPIMAGYRTCDGCSGNKLKMCASCTGNYKTALESYNTMVADLEATPEFLERKQRYKETHRIEEAAALQLFGKPRDLPRSGEGWTLDPSIVTDGVGVSLQYSWKKSDEDRLLGGRTAGKVRVVSKPKPKKPAAPGVAEYETDLATADVNILEKGRVTVAGVDPGRSNIAVVACISKDGKIDSWDLTRGHFYKASGLNTLKKVKQRRYTNISPKMQALGESTSRIQGDDEAEAVEVGSGLRTASPGEIEEYCRRYSDMRTGWWDLALKRRESRDTLKSYIGRRKVLDKFFSGVKQKLTSLYPGTLLHIGYGSAYQSMKPTGRGETAVPTTGAFKACQRIFGVSNVSVVDEHKTTQVDWKTGTKKVPVRRDLSDEKLRCHSEEELKLKEQMPVWHRSKWVRGLRFCPERRLFLNRDREAAVCIARLRTVELQGRGRPSPFCRSSIRSGV